jgi:hypothetical protein
LVILDKLGMTIFYDPFMNLRLSLAFLLLFLPRALAAPSTNAAPAKPEPPAPVAAPAFVDVVTFKIESGGDKEQLIVTSAPGLVRIDAPDDRMSVIYDPATEHYTGLEHSNYTWWEFTWPEVRDAVENTPRYAARLRDMGPELLEENAVAPPATNSGGSPATDSATPPASDSAGTDDFGYVWHTDPEKKRISGYDCVHWIGETVSGERIDAWCAPSLLPPVENALQTLQTVNEPIALVPVRNFMPPLAFVAWKTLTKGGVTPVMMTWGSDTEFNSILLVGAKQRDGKLSYFQIPKLYVKTTLVTMDGIGNQKPETLQRDAPNQVFSNPILNNR